MPTPSDSKEYRRRYAKLHRNGYRTLVDNLGASRRLQALRAIGYSERYLAKRLGVDKQRIQSICNRRRPKIRLDAHKAICALYDELSWQPQFGPAAECVKTWAKRAGYAPPGAWDDIDDPNDYPKGVLWAA